MKKGFSFLEITIALGIMSIFMTIFLFYINFSRMNIRKIEIYRKVLKEIEIFRRDIRIRGYEEINKNESFSFEEGNIEKRYEVKKIDVDIVVVLISVSYKNIDGEIYERESEIYLFQ